MLRAAARLGAIGCLAFGATVPAVAAPQWNPFASKPAPAPAGPEYQVQMSRIYAVLPSQGDVMNVKAAIAAAIPFPVVGYIDDKLGKSVALTTEQVAAKLKAYKNDPSVNGGSVRLLDFIKWAHLDRPKTLEQELSSRLKNMARGDIITNMVYGGNRPPDQVYLSYDGPKARHYCSLPLLGCGDNYYSMSEGTLKDLKSEKGSLGPTNRALTYYLWDANPSIISDKELGKFEMDPAAEAGKGWNVVAIDGGTETGSSLYLIEYCVVKKGEPIPAQ